MKTETTPEQAMNDLTRQAQELNMGYGKPLTMRNEIIDLTKQIDRLCRILENGIKVRNDPMYPIPDHIRIVREKEIYS